MQSCIRKIINIIDVFGTTGRSDPANRATHHPHSFLYNTVPGPSAASTMRPIAFSNCQILQVRQVRQIRGRALPPNPIRPAKPKFRGRRVKYPKSSIRATSRLSQNSGKKNSQNGTILRKCPKSQRADPWDLPASPGPDHQQTQFSWRIVPSKNEKPCWNRKKVGRKEPRGRSKTAEKKTRGGKWDEAKNEKTFEGAKNPSWISQPTQAWAALQRTLKAKDLGMWVNKKSARKMGIKIGRKTARETGTKFGRKIGDRNKGSSWSRIKRKERFGGKNQSQNQGRGGSCWSSEQQNCWVTREKWRARE